MEQTHLTSKWLVPRLYFDYSVILTAFPQFKKVLQFILCYITNFIGSRPQFYPNISCLKHKNAIIYDPIGSIRATSQLFPWSSCRQCEIRCKVPRIILFLSVNATRQFFNARAFYLSFIHLFICLFIHLFLFLTSSFFKSFLSVF
jgi:hypothetical protein